MMDTDHDPLPGLTIESRAEIFGASYLEQRADEARYPFLAHWAGRHGAAPDHWKAYRVAGRPAVDRDAACVTGEQPIVRAFRSALAQVPDPVAWLIVYRCVVMCGGREADASWSGFPMLPPAPPVERTLIQMHVPDELTAAHEIAHDWTGDPSSICSRFSAARVEELAAAAVGLTVLRGDVEAWRRERDQHERAADHLASLWLKKEMDTTSGPCGQRRRENFEREVERQIEHAVASSRKP